MINDNTPSLSCRGRITVKNGRNLRISDPKLDLLNTNACAKFGLNTLTFTEVIARKQKYWLSLAEYSVKIWRNCPLTIPDQNSTISMHIPSLVKIYWCLLIIWQIIIRKRNTDRRTYDWRTYRQTDVQRETIIPRHYRIAGYKNPHTQFKVYCAHCHADIDINTDANVYGMQTVNNILLFISSGDIMTFKQ